MWRFGDLFALGALGVLAALGVFVPGWPPALRLAAGTPFAFFAPGYLAIGSLLEGRGMGRRQDAQLSAWGIRALLGVGASAAIVMVLTLALNFTSAGIQASTVIGVLVVWCLLFGFLVVHGRRNRTDDASMTEDTRASKGVVGVLTVATISLLAAGILLPLLSPAAQHPLEFAVQETPGLQAALSTSQPSSVLTFNVTIRTHESTAAGLTIASHADPGAYAFDPSQNATVFQPTANGTLSLSPVQIQGDGSATVPVQVQVPAAHGPFAVSIELRDSSGAPL